MTPTQGDRTGLVWDERFARYDPAPASPNGWNAPFSSADGLESKRRIWSLLQASGLASGLAPIAPRPAGEQELLRAHSSAYLDRLSALAAGGGGDAGDSALVSRSSLPVARLAAGGCIEAADRIVRGDVRNAYALVRPRGHHAERERGRGFCVFANAVLAARHLQAVHGIERIAIIDWDVHHGNGAQKAFYAERNVLTVSLHQEGYYPADSGGVDERGEGAGLGSNLNLPLPPGSGHGAYLSAFDEIVLPALAAFRPEFVIVACGFDAAIGDPFGRMLCTSETFRQMTKAVRDIADVHAGGRVLFCQEGGYSPSYAAYCALAVMEELSGIRTAVQDPLLAWYADIGGQDLQLHQAVRIEALGRILGVSPALGRAENSAPQRAAKGIGRQRDAA
ncbi:acetoin utilization deacetylase AcuC-like enzyme [Amorphus suaedae]